MLNLEARDPWQLTWSHESKGVVAVERFPSYEALMQRLEAHVNWARERLVEQQYTHTIATIHSVWVGTTETRYT